MRKSFIMFGILLIIFMGYLTLYKTTNIVMINAKDYNLNSGNVSENTLKISLKDEKNIPISKTEFTIKEIIYEIDSAYKNLPTNPSGESVGKIKEINGENVAIFETDENGDILVDLKNGIYEIEQISIVDGYEYSQDGKVWLLGVNDSRKNTINSVVKEPLYLNQVNAESEPTQYSMIGREDGYSLYYYKGYLTLIDPNNNIEWTIASEPVYQMIARNDGFDCLENQRIVQYNNDGKIIKTISYGSGMRCFAKDSNGNYVIGVQLDFGTRKDIEIVRFNSNNRVEVRNYINGAGEESLSSLIIKKDGDYVLTGFIGSNTIETNSRTIPVRANKYYIMTIDKETLEIKKISETKVDSGYDRFRRVNNVKEGKNGELFYAGTFTDPISFFGTETKNGETITVDSNGNEDVIVIKYTPDLLIEWATNIGGSGVDHFYQIDLTPDNGVFLAGDSDYGKIKVNGNKSASGYPIETKPITEKTEKWRGISAKVDENGKVVWANEFGFSANEGCYAAVAFKDNTYAIGGFESATGGTEGNAMFIRVSEEELNTAIEQKNLLEVINSKTEFYIKTTITSKGGTVAGSDTGTIEYVKYGESEKTINIIPKVGYRIKNIKVNENNIKFEPEEDGSYVLLLANVTENQDIQVEFEKQPVNVENNNSEEEKQPPVISEVNKDNQTKSEEINTGDNELTILISTIIMVLVSNILLSKKNRKKISRIEKSLKK